VRDMGLVPGVEITVVGVRKAQGPGRTFGPASAPQNLWCVQ